MTNIKKLRHSIHEILFCDWDPIGVNDEPLCEDEYDGYISGVFRLLQCGADEQRLSEHLTLLEVESMGLSNSDTERNKRVARQLFELVN